MTRNKIILLTLMPILAIVGAWDILWPTSEFRSEVYSPNGIALKGYDPVAFFKASTPMKGNDAFSYNWKGVTWKFANEDHLKAFKAAPEVFSPQYGGYCAYGTAEGHKAPIAIETWSIIDGKLYFNYNQDVKKLWISNQRELIRKANKNWPILKTKNQ